VLAGALKALREHWPEYLIEAFALGAFMVSAGCVATLLGSPQSPLAALVPDPPLRRVLGGLAMGTTAVALIYSPWGRRSGAHMNPAVTLSFLRLGKTRGADAFFYIVAQFMGGTLGVIVVAAGLGAAFTSAPVSYAATLPGSAGPAAAFVAEFAISAVMMFVILRTSSNAQLARYTGLFAGALVAAWIALEEPLSGMSMNPARSFASAAPGGHWQWLWIYCTAPVLGMLTAAELHRRLSRDQIGGCAKLRHTPAERCIHCGHQPTANAVPASNDGSSTRTFPGRHAA
jgi:aquaporin Z